MSEGPEVHRIAAKLHEELAGSSIVAVDSRLKKAKAWLEEHPGLVEGKRVERVYAAGKNLLWELDDNIYFHMHLLMFGKIRTFSLRHRVEYERTLRALIVTSTRQVVLYNVQVFNIGVGDPFEQIEGLRRIGADLCAVPFNTSLFLERLNAPEHRDEEIGPVLLDQSVAAGVGNYLKSDILFECRINPWAKVGDLTPEEQQCLAETIPAVGQRTLKVSGQTVTDEVMDRILADPNIARPTWQHRHWVFRHTNKPCKVCGTPIRARRQGPGEGRMTFYCPQCQGVEAA